MGFKPVTLITILSSELTPKAQLTRPRKFIIKSGSGAQSNRAWLELYNEDIAINATLEDWLEIQIEGSLCFSGRIREIRIDSKDDHITLFAEWDPEIELRVNVDSQFQNQSINAMLNSLLEATPLNRADAFSPVTTIQKIELSNHSIFFAIDLLAKLAGNWYWDIQNQTHLRFRPPYNNPDHYLLLKHDKFFVNLWQSAAERFSKIEIKAGLDGQNPLESTVILPELNLSTANTAPRVFTRPLCSADGLALFASAVRQQMLSPNYNHYVDIADNGWQILPGDTVQFQAGVLPIFPQNQKFRVTQRDITYAHEMLETRLHLTSGFESAPTYFHYFRQDTTIAPSFLLGRVGPFQADVSALDSSAHLDAG